MNEIINSIEKELNFYIHKNINYYHRSIDLHNDLKEQVANMAEAFDLKANMEYKIYDEMRNGYIDVVWKNNNKNIVFAIEIDSSIRLKSIDKLNKIEAENKIWILYCSCIYKNKFNNLLKLYNKNKDIEIIYLGDLRKQIKKNKNSP